MADEDDTTAPEMAPVETPAPEEKKFSQADLDRVVQERLDRDRRSRGGPQKPKADAPQAAQQDDRVTLKQLQAELQSDRIEREFDRLALREKLSEEQADALRPVFKVWRGTAEGDGAEWLRSIRGAFGGGQPTPTTPKPTAAKPTGPSVSDAGSPAAPHVVTEDTPLMQLSAEDRMHLIKTKGSAWYNATLRQQLKGTRVVLRKP